MALQASQTWRASVSPGGTRSATGAPQLLQNFMMAQAPSGDNYTVTSPRRDRRHL
jgi:hypothetical protein